MPPSVPLKTNCRKQTSSPSPSPRCSALGPQRPSRTGPGHRGAGQRPPQRPHSRAPERSPATAGNRPVTHAATWTNLKEITRAENSRAQNEIQSQKLTNSETGAKWLSEGHVAFLGEIPPLGPGSHRTPHQGALSACACPAALSRLCGKRNDSPYLQ